MIVFDLECSNGHLFEGWFDNFDAFEEQNKEGLIKCPYCDNVNIKRVLSPMAVMRSSSNNMEETAAIDYERLTKEVINHIHTNYDDMGSNFAAEALKIHYGVAEKRNIRGSATSEEEKILKKEGIEVLKVPLLKIEDSNKN